MTSTESLIAAIMPVLPPGRTLRVGHHEERGYWCGVWAGGKYFAPTVDEALAMLLAELREVEG